MFTIDARAALLVDASPSGWRALGLEPRTVNAPLAIDGATPALQRLRQIGSDTPPTRRDIETLTFWTASGPVHLPCRITVHDAAVFTATVLDCGSDGAVAGPRQTEILDVRDVSRPDLPAQEPESSRNARLAHELRTPLSAVIAYAEILKDEHFGPLPSERYRDYARHIYESARHALGVADSILRDDASRSVVPPLAFADLEPAGLVESCLVVARPLAERSGLELGVAYAPRLPRIIADELTVKQMLLNLLSNAIKFARRGDRVTVSVAYDGDGPLSISVADTGPGMDAERAHQSSNGHDASCQTKNGAGPGRGIGLPLTRALAAANGATLEIASQPSAGTCVTISFAQDRIVPI